MRQGENKSGSKGPSPSLAPLQDLFRVCLEPVWSTTSWYAGGTTRAPANQERGRVVFTISFAGPSPLPAPTGTADDSPHIFATCEELRELCAGYTVLRAMKFY